ncbi:hypothetical protein T4B_15061, partial [Trichinella pseudospiralis]
MNTVIFGSVVVCKPYCAYNSTLTLTQLNLLCATRMTTAIFGSVVLVNIYIFSVVLLRFLLCLKIKTIEARSMAFYTDLSEKSKIKTSEDRSMAFYKGLSEKSKVDGVDFKNR